MQVVKDQQENNEARMILKYLGYGKKSVERIAPIHGNEDHCDSNIKKGTAATNEQTELDTHRKHLFFRLFGR